MKHIIAYSGGHSSALVAIEVCRKFGAENVVLPNHDINPAVEPADVKRFKNEVAGYLGLPITYANHPEWETETPISLCVKAGTWVNPANRTILCTNRLKTAPAFDWYAANYNEGDIVYFGFDANEPERVTRRANMTKAATLTHYHNQTTLICRADGSYWFGLSKYFVNHLRAKR